MNKEWSVSTGGALNPSSVSGCREIFKHMLHGYALQERICDVPGGPADYRFLDVNPAFERIIGQHSKALIGHTMREVLPETAVFWIETFERVVATGVPVHVDYFSATLKRHFEVAAFATESERIGCTVADITDRKQAEAQLRQSEEKWRRLFETMSEGVFYQSADGTFTDINAAALRMFGLTRDQFFSRTSMHSEWDVLKEDGTPLRGDEHPSMQALRTGQPIKQTVVGVFNPIKQDYVWLEVNAVPEFHEGETTPYQVVETLHDLTERKRAEMALRESEMRYKRSQQVAKVGSWEYHLATGFFWGSDEARRLYALPSENVALTPDMVENCIPERERVHQALVDLIERGTPYDLEFEIHPADGSPARIIASVAECLRDDQGRALKVMGAVRDITMEKQAEEQLISIAKFPAENLNPVLRVSHEGHLLYVNEAGQHKLADWDLTVGQSVPELLQQLVSKAINSGARLTGEVVIKHRIISFDAVSIEGEQYVNLYGKDITEREKARQELAAEKERLAVTLRSIGDGVISTDTDGRVVMLNKAAEVLTGWTLAEAAGRPLSEIFQIIHEYTRLPCENPAEKVMKTGKVIELANHTCLIAKDGREIIIADSSAPIHDKNSRVIGVVLVFRDMTERQRLDDFIRRTQKLESLGLLAGGIAHDFNNLLTGIFGYIEIAKDETHENSVLHNLGKALGSIDRARALTQQLLTFAKGGAPIKTVAHLFPFVQETVQFALSGSSVSSNFTVPDALYPCDYDKNQLGQVIENLVINAQQAMPDGGSIEVTANNVVIKPSDHLPIEPGRYVKLAFIDHGIGIPKEFLPRIFDPYYTTKTKGHGLGLATCYSIAEKHGGTIEVTSEPGKGCCFTLYLPSSDRSVLPTEVEEPRTHTGRGTFLVMDDEDTIRELTKYMLEACGYDVVLKTNGEDAISFVAEELAAHRTLAGMMFDLTIPGGMGGKEAIAKIRELSATIPVFVASGYSADPIMANPELYGFTASIAKPFRKADLHALLKHHM